MPKTLTVRVIRTYHVDVQPEYGDTEDSIKEKGLIALTRTKPDDEQVVLLPEGADR